MFNSRNGLEYTNTVCYGTIDRVYRLCLRKSLLCAQWTMALMLVRELRTVE